MYFGGQNVYEQYWTRSCPAIQLGARLDIPAKTPKTFPPALCTKADKVPPRAAYANLREEQPIRQHRTAAMNTAPTQRVPSTSQVVTHRQTRHRPWQRSQLACWASADVLCLPTNFTGTCTASATLTCLHDTTQPGLPTRGVGRAAHAATKHSSPGVARRSRLRRPRTDQPYAGGNRRARATKEYRSNRGWTPMQPSTNY